MQYSRVTVGTPSLIPLVSWRGALHETKYPCNNDKDIPQSVGVGVLGLIDHEPNLFASCYFIRSAILHPYTQD